MEAERHAGPSGVLQPDGVSYFLFTRSRHGVDRLAVAARRSAAERHATSSSGSGCQLERIDLAGMVAALPRPQASADTLKIPPASGGRGRCRGSPDCPCGRVPERCEHTTMNAAAANTDFRLTSQTAALSRKSSAKGNRIMAAAVISRGNVSGLENKDFERLAVPLLDGLYNFACWLSGDPDEARDLVQETFVKSLKGFSSFREGTNFRAWMYRILRNTFLTSRTGLERRNTQQEDEEGLAEISISQETPEVALIRRADTELVQAAIANLPPAFREVILLADLEEMKYQEIAQALDIPIGTVMSRLARARKQVREHIVLALGGRRTVG